VFENNGRFQLPLRHKLHSQYNYILLYLLGLLISIYFIFGEADMTGCLPMGGYISETKPSSGIK